MARPTHILRHEHRVIEQGLRALDGMCLRLKSGGSVPPDALEQMLDFIQNFADRFHHAREEAFLFPALEQSGMRQGDSALMFLRKEHDVERHLLAELELAAEEYRYGSTEASDRFVTAAVQFRDHLVGHIQKEDTLLYHLAEELLDEEVKLTLIHDFAHDRGQTGEEITARYEQMARDLEKMWAL